MPDDEGGKSKEPKDQKRREQILVGAAVAGVILTVLLIKRSSANAAGQGNQAQNASQLPNYGSVPPAAQGSYGSGVSGEDYNYLNTQFQGLGTQLTALSSQIGSLSGSSSPTPISSNPGGQTGVVPAPSIPGPVAGPAPYTLPGQTFIGSGYGPGNTNTIFDSSGTGYDWINNPSAVPGILAAGESTYYEPTPGKFLPTGPNSGLAPGTPQFARH